MKMNSEAYLCDICSEIYGHEEELSAHMLEDHNVQYLPLLENPIAVTDDNEAGELIVPDIQDLNSMMEVTDEIDFRPFTSTGDPIPSAEFCLDVPVELAAEQPEEPKLAPSTSGGKKKTLRGKKGGGEMHTCEFCSYTTQTKSCMTSHRLTHTLDCPFCQYKTIIPHRLTAHLRNKHFNNNSWDRLGQQSKKTLLLRKDYMKDDFIFAEEMITYGAGTEEDQDEASEDIRGESGDKVDEGQAGEFRYLRPSVIIASRDIQQVDQAYEFIRKRGFVGQR